MVTFISFRATVAWQICCVVTRLQSVVFTDTHALSFRDFQTGKYCNFIYIGGGGGVISCNVHMIINDLCKCLFHPSLSHYLNASVLYSFEMIFIGNAICKYI